MSIAARVPPQSIEAEQALLGSMLLSNDAAWMVTEVIKSQDFYREAHAIIYRAVINLLENGEPVDLLTVTENLRRQGELEQVGGVAYVASLADTVPTAANVLHYAQLVEQKAILRNLQTAATSVVRMVDEPMEVGELLDRAEQMIFTVREQRKQVGVHLLKDVLMVTLDKLEQIYKRKEKITGLSTGFDDLDDICSGFQKSDLILVAARPGMGKTSFGLNVALSVAVKLKQPVVFFSLEMSREQVAQRLLCSEAMVDQQKLRTGRLQESEWRRLVKAVGQLAEAPIFIDDTAGISPLEIRAKVRRLKLEYPLALVVIDYLQLMQSSKKVENRVQEISDISRSLKALGREMDLPVLALTQLSRSVEQRQDKRPMLSELREGGSQEQDSDMVIFIYRDEYYNPDSDKRGIAELIVAKQRNGPIGTVNVGYLAEFTRFVNLEKRMSAPEGAVPLA